MKRRKILVLILISAALIIGAALANTHEKDPDTIPISTKTEPAAEQAPTPVTDDRGQLLYENHCGGCHDESVYSRNPKKAQSTADIQKWVLRWSQQLELDWNDKDIGDVTNYLNQHFYHFSAEE